MQSCKYTVDLSEAFCGVVVVDDVCRIDLIIYSSIYSYIIRKKCIDLWLTQNAQRDKNYAVFTYNKLCI
jgi:hypothetical protein